MSTNDDLFSGAAFQSFFKTSPQSLVLKADLPHFTILAVSDNFLELVHKQREELLGRGLFKVFPGSGADPSEQNSVFSSFRRVIETGLADELPVFKYEIFVPESGQPETHHLTNVNQPVLEDNEVSYIINTTTNITGQIRQQEREISLNQELRRLNLELEEHVMMRTRELANAVEGLNVALDAGNFGTTEVDLVTGNMVCNERFKNLFGRFNGENMTYPDMFSAMLPEYRENVRARSKKAQAEHSLYEATYEIAWPDGSIHWIEAHGRARYDAYDKPDRMVGILADVTEQVNARTQLERTEAYLRLATETAALGIWYINAETLEFYPSNRLKELFGFYPDEVMPYEAAVNQIAESHRKKVTDAVDLSIRKGRSYDIEYPIIGYHDQQVRWVRATGRLFEANAGEPAHFSGTIIDITAQINSLQAIQKSQEELRISRDETQLAIDAASLATFDFNPSGSKFRGNSLIKEWFGLQPEEEIELSKATDVIAEADREKVLAAIRDALIYELGGHYEISYTIINPFDLVPRIVKAKGKTQFNEQGEPIRLSGVLQDITEQRLDELRKNDFIGMVSHELKMPLTSLTAIVQVANHKLKNSEDAFLAGAMEKANTQVKRMSAMINGFLNVSRLESSKLIMNPQRFDLEELIEETIKETELTVFSHHFHFFPCRPVLIEADHDKIGSVLTNLISNAVKYSPKGKEVDIKCEIIGKRAQVSIKDEGIGLRPQDIEKVFERYYRVESDPTQHISGFGIGLYLSAEIIHRHGGEIWVESESGRGSTFYFSLPLSLAS